MEDVFKNVVNEFCFDSEVIAVSAKTMYVMLVTVMEVIEVRPSWTGKLREIREVLDGRNADNEVDAPNTVDLDFKIIDEPLI